MFEERRETRQRVYGGTRLPFIVVSVSAKILSIAQDRFWGWFGVWVFQTRRRGQCGLGENAADYEERPRPRLRVKRGRGTFLCLCFFGGSRVFWGAFVWIGVPTVVVPPGGGVAEKAPAIVAAAAGAASGRAARAGDVPRADALHLPCFVPDPGLPRRTFRQGPADILLLLAKSYDAGIKGYS